MTWTVGRRIALALAIELVLLVVVAVVGAGKLGQTTDTYEGALAVRRSTVVPALRVESEVRGANVEQLRLLASGEERYAHRRDSMVTMARGLAIALFFIGSGLLIGTPCGMLIRLLKLQK